MMTNIETYVRRSQGTLRSLAADPQVRKLAGWGGYLLTGLVLSAGSLAGHPLPLAMGLVCALTGEKAALIALGGGAGYLLFWGVGGYQGLLWLGLALCAALAVGKRRVAEESAWLMSALGALILSLSGLLFQLFWRDTTPVPIHLLRVALGAGATRLFQLVRGREDPMADWLVQGLGVLALAQIAPFPGFSLGYLAAGAMAAAGAFPAAAAGGLALDLAQITQVPMTAVLCLSYLTRLLPWGERWLRYTAPGAVYLLVMTLGGYWDPVPAVGLAVGGILAVLLPPGPALSRRRRETGLAQVRLELMANVLAQTQTLLLEAPSVPVDEDAILTRTRERACGSCPSRKTCREQLSPLPRQLLHRPMYETASLPISCRKPGRLILELRRSQEQLRSIKADRDRREEYRAAVIQQYQFLTLFLQQLSDQLSRRGERLRQRFTAEVYVSGVRKEEANGDRCIWFMGPGCRYYVLLCDGMGTGLGAAQEGQSAAALLKRMLCAGFPAEHALRSLNSILALRGGAGSVTVDLAELRLDQGRGMLYKWGAAPSYLLLQAGTEKIGTAGPPPGLSVKEGRETAERLSLRRGEVLILLSDGVDGEDALRHVSWSPEDPPGELAEQFLEHGARGEDDATVAVVRLCPGVLST